MSKERFNMDTLIERFTLIDRTDEFEKLKMCKPNCIEKENYKYWKVDADTMFKDAMSANKIGISYPRQLQMVHGAIERILKSYIIKEYGLEISTHEISVIYNSIKKDFETQLNKADYNTLKTLDFNFILYRHPNSGESYNEDVIDSCFAALVNLNTIIEEKLSDNIIID